LLSFEKVVKLILFLFFFFFKKKKINSLYSIITESGVSVSNSSFVTAQSDDSEYSDESDIDNLRNTNVKISGDSDSEYEESDSDQSPIAEQNPMSPLTPRSIPYESYLKRYRLTYKKPSPVPFSNSFLRPSRVLFIPARVFVILLLLFICFTK
jgi:hypothetical protein